MITIADIITAYTPGEAEGYGHDIDIVAGADITIDDSGYDRIHAVHLVPVDRAAAAIEVPPRTIVLVTNTVTRAVTVYRAVGGDTDDGPATALDQIAVRFLGAYREHNAVTWRDWLAWLWRTEKPRTLYKLLNERTTGQ